MKIARLILELHESLHLYASDKKSRRFIFACMRPLLKSVCVYDLNLAEARKRYVLDRSTRNLACELRRYIHKRTLHFYDPVNSLDVLSIL